MMPWRWMRSLTSRIRSIHAGWENAGLLSLSLSLRHQRLEFLALPLRALQFTALALATEHLQCPTREFRVWGVGML